MTEWVEAELGDLFAVDNARLGPHTSEPIVMSLSKYDGFVRADEYFDKRIASAKLDDYKVVNPGGWAYSTIHIDEGSIARNNLGEVGVISPMYTTMRWVGDQVCVPELAELIVREPAMLAAYKDSAQGSINRRMSLPFKTFARMKVTLPPLPVQQRVVQVIGAVDDQIAALDAESGALAGVLRVLRAELVDDSAFEAVTAQGAFEFSTGVRRTPDRASGPHMTPYLRSANVGYGVLDLSDVLEMNYEPFERERFSLRPGDVLVSEGSASAKAVGMPAMWRDELPGPVCFQMTLLRLRAIAGVSIPGFAFHWCMWAYESGRFLDVAGGTNIKHISAKRSSQMPVRLPTLERQRHIVDELDSMEAVLNLTRAEAERLRGVRVSLLSTLLNRDIEIEAAEEAVA